MGWRQARPQVPGCFQQEGEGVQEGAEGKVVCHHRLSFIKLVIDSLVFVFLIVLSQRFYSGAKRKIKTFE